MDALLVAHAFDSCELAVPYNLMVSPAQSVTVVINVPPLVRLTVGFALTVITVSL